MKRLRRILGTTAALVSLVLCLACVGFWVRSCFASDMFDYSHGPTGAERDIGIVLSDGTVKLFWLNWPDSPPHPGFRHIALGVEPATNYPFHWFADIGSFQGKAGSAPLWAPAALFAAWPLIWTPLTVREICRRRRIRSGHCQSCGYDLRATPQRCPECGATPGATR